MLQLLPLYDFPVLFLFVKLVYLIIKKKVCSLGRFIYLRIVEDGMIGDSRKENFHHVRLVIQSRDAERL